MSKNKGTYKWVYTLQLSLIGYDRKYKLNVFAKNEEELQDKLTHWGIKLNYKIYNYKILEQFECWG